MSSAARGLRQRERGRERGRDRHTERETERERVARVIFPKDIFKIAR
jgi:hypothetical protein